MMAVCKKKKDRKEKEREGEMNGGGGRRAKPFLSFHSPNGSHKACRCQEVVPFCRDIDFIATD